MKLSTMICVTITLPDYDRNDQDADKIAGRYYAKVMDMMSKFECDGWTAERDLSFFGVANLLPFADLLAMDCQVQALKACNTYIKSRAKKGQR